MASGSTPRATIAMQMPTTCRPYLPAPGQRAAFVSGIPVGPAVGFRATSIRPGSTRSRVAAEGKGAVGMVGPPGPKPTYDDSGLVDATLLRLFKEKMADEIGEGTEVGGYEGMMDLTWKLNSKYASPRGTQEATIRILCSLFPSWLLPLFQVFLAKPLPDLSAQMNAWVTKFSSQWLMGPSEVNDVEIDGGRMGEGHGLKVERCRYLEEAGCVSVCLNSCKVPTQEFFATEMGLPLTMTPNYEDFSCQFSFGKTPPPQDEDEAFGNPCFQGCPSLKGAAPPMCPGSAPSSERGA